MNAIIGFTTLAVSNINNKKMVRNYPGKILYPAIICFH